MKSNLLSQLDYLIARHIKCALILKLSATMPISPVSEMQGSSFRLITRNWCSSAELVRCLQEVYAISLVQTYRDITGIFQLARVYVIFCQKITLSLCQKYEENFWFSGPTGLLFPAPACCGAGRAALLSQLQKHRAPVSSLSCSLPWGQSHRVESIIPSGEKERERWASPPSPFGVLNVDVCLYKHTGPVPTQLFGHFCQQQ